jgi:RNA recognition motif-containing protein
MGKKLYAGNLSYSTTEDELRALFQEAGTVTSVTIITDRDTGRSKGFGFVEMETEEQAQEAIEKLNGRMLNERTITVSEARPPRESGGGGRYGGGGRDRGGRPGGRGDRRDRDRRGWNDRY